MSKWADFLVSNVKYSKDPKKIVSVKIHKFTGDSVGKEEIWTRSRIIEHIDKNEIIFTIFKSANGGMDKGKQTKKVMVKNAEYLRTDTDASAEDHLEKLPEF
jgi:hypothetical protein